MKRFLMLCMMCSVFHVVFCSHAVANDATPREVMDKVKAAVRLVSQENDACFPEFNDPLGKWVWGGTYVFIMKCDQTMLVTHPINPKLIGRDLSAIKDKFGNYFFSQMCEEAKKPKGGWTEYYWPKPGEKGQSRKISFVLPIEGTPYQAGAGLYDETIDIDTLKSMTP